MAQKRYSAKEVADAIRQAEGVVKDAAELLGCSRMTVYRYAAEYTTVEQAMETARKPLVLEARGWMREMMRKPEHRDHYKATLKVLTVYDDELEWSDKQRQEIAGNPEKPVRVIFKSRDD